MAQKVSQSTIDQIKKMGMAKALKLAGQNASATQAGVTAEWAEGVRRMYGQKRYDAAAKAAGSSTPAKLTPAKSTPAPKEKTTYNRYTGEKVTYTEKPKAAAKPKAKTPAEPPKYNRYTGQKVDYTTKKAAPAPKPKAKKPLPPAPKYNRYTQQKVK